jgi:predicted RNA-binding Zn ribbon-like protein
MNNPPPKKFRLIAGNLALDFCNTVGGKREKVSRERLESYEDLISWCEQAGLLDKDEADALRRKATTHPAEAKLVLQRAVALREAIYGIVFAVAHDRGTKKADLSCLNQELERALCCMQVVRREEGFEWKWACAGSLGSPLGPIARSAAELLTDGKSLPHAHQCQADNCGWLFVDSSKNRSRRWCDMRECGNRAKVRRHREKAKGD